MKIKLMSAFLFLALFVSFQAVQFTSAYGESGSNERRMDCLPAEFVSMDFKYKGNWVQTVSDGTEFVRSLIIKSGSYTLRTLRHQIVCYYRNIDQEDENIYFGLTSTIEMPRCEFTSSNRKRYNQVSVECKGEDQCREIICSR